MKKITTKQRQCAGNIYCDWCRPEKIHAIYYSRGKSNRACENHKYKIEELEKREERYSEADYQTWMKL